jgi:hydrogenase maturation protease
MKMKENKRFLILGVGNILLKDEGLGVRTIDYLQETYISPPNVSLIDGGTGGLNLLSLMKDYTHVIIIDAIAPNGSPGALYRIPSEELPKSPPMMTTAHQLGVQDMLALAHLEGYNPDVVIIGMEPLDMSPGLELSPLIQEKLPAIADMVRDELGKHGIVMEQQVKDA